MLLVSTQQRKCRLWLKLSTPEEHLRELREKYTGTADEAAIACTEPIWISLNVERIRALQRRVADAMRVREQQYAELVEAAEAASKLPSVGNLYRLAQALANVNRGEPDG
jgi:hypothetical protein